MRILTFLGVRNLDRVTYVWENRECTTELFPEALGAWFRNESPEMLVLLTDAAAQSKQWGRLQARLRDTVRVVPQTIPAGRNENELWAIFDVLAEKMGSSPAQEIVLDITHAFRSVPVLALLALSFLRTARAVKLKHILYGAFDARDEKTNRAPVFDLSPFVGLLDWVNATDQFIQTGNASALAKLITSDAPEVQPLAETVNGIAEGLHLLRPMSVMRLASLLPARSAAAAPHVASSTPPFATLLGRIEDAYGRFGVASPEDYAANAKECLRRQLEMIEWFYSKGQIVHALSLAREWVPSLLCYHFQVDPMNADERADMELLLAGGVDKDRNWQSPRLAEWLRVPCGTRLRTLWGGHLNLAKLRNDVLHAGFRKNPKDVTEIARQTTEIISALRKIASEWKL